MKSNSTHPNDGRIDWDALREISEIQRERKRNFNGWESRTPRDIQMEAGHQKRLGDLREKLSDRWQQAESAAPPASPIQSEKTSLFRRAVLAFKSILS